MVSNVTPPGGPDGSTPIRHVQKSTEEDQPVPTTRLRDDRLPPSFSSRRPAPIGDAQQLNVTTARSQRSEASDDVIDPNYIEALEAKAIAAYPTDRNYASTVIRFPPSLPNEIGGAKHDISPYNPLDLRLPFHLFGYAVLYDLEPVRTTDVRAEAVTSHLELVKQYNLAYIDFLRAANGSDEALSRLEANLVNGGMLSAAGVRMALRDIDASSLLHSIQGHLCLNVLRCPDPEVPTAARIRALEIVQDHFDVTAIAEVLGGEAGKGLRVRGHERIFDLIPERFIANEEERTKSHASRFLRNEVVQSILFDNGRRARPFNLSVFELYSKYPEETVQMLVSIMRVAGSEPQAKSAAFRALISLTMLDESSKERIFGENASYRNGGKSLSEPAADADGDSIH